MNGEEEKNSKGEDFPIENSQKQGSEKEEKVMSQEKKETLEDQIMSEQEKANEEKEDLE